MNRKSDRIKQKIKLKESNNMDVLADRIDLIYSKVEELNTPNAILMPVRERYLKEQLIFVTENVVCDSDNWKVSIMSFVDFLDSYFPEDFNEYNEKIKGVTSMCSAVMERLFRDRYRQTNGDQVFSDEWDSIMALPFEEKYGKVHEYIELCRKYFFNKDDYGLIKANLILHFLTWMEIPVEWYRYTTYCR